MLRLVGGSIARPAEVWFEDGVETPVVAGDL
jgi:hypothetical protein